MTKLPYKVESKRPSNYPHFELIAAFDCAPAATGYAGECALANPAFSYRVKNGRKVLMEFGPHQS